MTQVSETTTQRRTPQKVPKPSRLGFASYFVRMLFANPGALKKARTMNPDEERYVRPPREYDLPEYRRGMPHCTSNEKYLRPTRYCNPQEPLVIAMANELGAYELSDWEFADAAYWFVKSNFLVEFLPLNSVSETLKRGTGTCFHLNSVWAALCRAAGIKARYRQFWMVLPDEIMSLAPTVGEAEGMTANMFNQGLPEVEGEVCIDGKWVIGHVAMRPENYAVAGLPILRFGEDPVGLIFPPISGPIKHWEGMNSSGLALRAFLWLAPAAIERANVVVKETVPMGRKIIEEAGGLEEYDRKARSKSERIPIEKLERTLKAVKRPQFVEFKR